MSRWTVLQWGAEALSNYDADDWLFDIPGTSPPHVGRSRWKVHLLSLRIAFPCILGTRPPAEASMQEGGERRNSFGSLPYFRARC
jgi:hypothetical protein